MIDGAYVQAPDTGRHHVKSMEDIPTGSPTDERRELIRHIVYQKLVEVNKVEGSVIFGDPEVRTDTTWLFPNGRFWKLHGKEVEAPWWLRAR